MVNRRTYRVVDGEQIEGTWRPIFIRNGDTCFLTDLLIYADGVIWCWEWVDLDGFRAKLESGWIATRLEPGQEGSAHGLATWRFDEPEMWVTADELLGEVADEIDGLNGRPDSTGRCRQALDRYLESRAEADRQSLRTAYLAIPEHLRLYALGDQDAKDRPLRVLCTPVGEQTVYGELVTEAMHAEALEYFAEYWRPADPRPGDGSEQAQDPTVELASIPGVWPSEPGIMGLRNEYPATVTVGGEVHPSAVHAYWSLAVADENTRATIRNTPAPLSVERAVGDAPLRPDWPHVRLAAMHMILRAKFDQHPALADVLIATGDARIEYSISSSFWSGGTKGRNWLGRLLELVRSELVAGRSSVFLRSE